MSAGICGKRVGFEDVFGSPSSQGPSAKRSRCSPFGSPTRFYDLGFGSEDKLSVLLRMFPSVDRKVVELVLETHDNKIDDAIKNLNALCLGSNLKADEARSLNATALSNESAVEGEILGNSRTFQNGSSWVDLFVQEMHSVSNWDDVRGKATMLLEAFEKNVIDNSMTSKEEIGLLKEHLQCVSKDNNILKKGIQIQRERNLEQEEKLKEVPQLKHFISQCQEQIRKLEMDNYTLRVYLQRAQESNSMPGHHHRDIF
ncbi:uncharacterized protein LOC109829891 isoform X2 [Asparagus officinalis]|uniref:uncharacterized protein LOC109829891 isoform X2 n=1 Tax=Asparagus officinalis TaxID=4686 RepID=UPI00098DF39B|nr:uncharacterized protein LOC109829891 isoform X2 [Asparagus officinalis]